MFVINEFESSNFKLNLFNVRLILLIILSRKGLFIDCLVFLFRLIIMVIILVFCVCKWFVVVFKLKLCCLVKCWSFIFVFFLINGLLFRVWDIVDVEIFVNLVRLVSFNFFLFIMLKYWVLFLEYVLVI